MKYLYKITEERLKENFDNLFETSSYFTNNEGAQGYYNLQRGYGVKSQNLENTILVETLQDAKIVIDYLSNHERSWDKTAPLKVIFGENPNFKGERKKDNPSFIQIGGRCSIHQFMHCEDGKLNDYIIIDEQMLEMRDMITKTYEKEHFGTSTAERKMEEENESLKKELKTLREKHSFLLKMLNDVAKEFSDKDELPF
jgi:hypothetical protein